jgi:hypothetical protein
MPARDPSLDVLLDLDGQVLVVDPDGGHWVRFVVTRVPVTAEKPHGEPQDHRHRLRTIKSYEYRDAATLLRDFWEAVDAVLRERGVNP